MNGHGISRLAVLAIATAALLGACSKHMDNEAMAAPPPPAAPEKPVLMGGPETTAGPATHAEAMASAARASDDAYVSSLPPGLMATHRIDPVTGASILVISNYPIANPTGRWRSHGVLYADGHMRSHHGHGGRLVATASNSHTVAETPAAKAAATPEATPAPTTTPAPMVARAAPSAAPVDVAPAQPATQSAGFKGMTLSPGMWIIGGLVLLAVVLLILLAGRKRKRGYDSRGAAHA